MKATLIYRRTGNLRALHGIDKTQRIASPCSEQQPV
jgi:hypothetical protein